MELSRIKRSVGGDRTCPFYLDREVVNRLLVFERKKRLDAEQSRVFMQALEDLPITIEATSPLHVFGHIHELAMQFGLSAYDAAYLELGLRNEIPLATLDSNLRAAAKASGAGIFEPE